MGDPTCGHCLQLVLLHIHIFVDYFAIKQPPCIYCYCLLPLFTEKTQYKSTHLFSLAARTFDENEFAFRGGSSVKILFVPFLQRGLL